MAGASVSKEHYFNENYFKIERFSSFHCQISNCMKLRPKTVLEIGVGNGICSNFLKSAGIKITTSDYDKSLNPDVVADMRELPFKESEFDLVIAFQVLEHVSYEDALKSLLEMKRVTSKYVIISLPYQNFSLYGYVKLLPFLKPIKFMWNIMDYWFIKFNPEIGTGEHFWELGTKEHSIRSLRKDLAKLGFKIVKEDLPVLNSHHYFFVLRC